MEGGPEYKEGVDFEWVTKKGTNVKTRRFFSNAEKKARAEAKKGGGKKKAAKNKTAPKTSKRPKARPGKEPGMTGGSNTGVRKKTTTTKEYSGRGGGASEVKTRREDSKKNIYKNQSDLSSRTKPLDDLSFKEYNNLSGVQLRGRYNLNTGLSRKEFEGLKSRRGSPSAPSTPEKPTAPKTQGTNSAAAPKVGGMTYEQYKNASLLSLRSAGLPSGMSKQEFTRRAKGTNKGYAKGGMVTRSRTGHTDHRKKGLFK